MGNKRKNRQSSGNICEKEKNSKIFKPRGPSEESEISLSEILNETNSVLYCTSDNVGSVFGGPCSGSEMSSEATGRPKEGPTNADILAYLEKINGRIGDVEKRLDSLSVLEKKVDGFDRELKKLWNAMEDRNKKLDARLSCVEEKVECSDFSVAQLESKVIQFEKERDSLKNEMKFPLRCILAGIYLSILVYKTDTASSKPAPAQAPAPAPTTTPAPATAAPATAAPAKATQNPAGGPNNGHSQPGGGSGGGNGGNGLHQITTGALSKFTGMLLVTLFINRYLMFL